MKQYTPFIKVELYEIKRFKKHILMIFRYTDKLFTKYFYFDTLYQYSFYH